MKKPVYLDYQATTPTDPRVVEAMATYWYEMPGNPHSRTHQFGWDAEEAVETARENIAKVIGADPKEIIFTSGATESNNMALKGSAEFYGTDKKHIITVVTEHKCVLDSCRWLAERGFEITYLPVEKDGLLDLAKLKEAIREDTMMVSVMHANNEIGVVQDIKSIGAICRENGVKFHTDAAQSFGKLPIDVNEMNVDVMSISSHKIYGPKGIGALYLRVLKPRVKLDSIMFGGGQERNIRSGTLNVPGIVGFAKAIEIAQKEMGQENEKFKKWMNVMLAKLSEAGAKLNGHPEKRLTHNLNVRFDGIESKAIINSVSKKIAISAGSACTTQIVEPSHVLLALGLAEDETHSSIRIGCGRFNTDEEIEIAADEIYHAVESLEKIRI